MALTGPDGSMVGAADEGAITVAAVVVAALEQQKLSHEIEDSAVRWHEADDIRMASRPPATAARAARHTSRNFAMSDSAFKLLPSS